MTKNLIIPASIEAVLQEFNAAKTVFTEHDVSMALGKARSALENPSDPENLGALSEVLAFSLAQAARESPWGTYFGPMGSGEKEGKIFYFPDVASAPPVVVKHWADRARALSQPLLKARYADLAWEMTPVVAQRAQRSGNGSHRN